jgi:hypothetical protein
MRPSPNALSASLRAPRIASSSEAHHAHALAAAAGDRLH